MSVNDGATATAAAQEEQVSEAGNTGVVVGFFSTPAPKLSAPKSRKHRGTVSSVRTLFSANKGTPGIEITIFSDSNGKPYKKTIWCIQQYADNPNMDASELDGLPAPEGKTDTPGQRYAKTIQNSKGTGELQELILATAKFVMESGRGFDAYTNFEELGTTLNNATSGASVIFTDKAEDTDTGFQVKINHIYPEVNQKGLDTFDSLTKLESAGPDGQ